MMLRFMTLQSFYLCCEAQSVIRLFRGSNLGMINHDFFVKLPIRLSLLYGRISEKPEGFLCLIFNIKTADV